MGYVFLIFIAFVYVIISYKLFEKDVLSPSFIVSITYFASITTAFIARVFNLWNNVDLNIEVVSVVMVGIASFILGEFIIRRILKKNIQKDTTKAEIGKAIKISNIKMIIIYLFMIITFLVIFYQMMDITGIRDNIAEMINSYREKTPLFNIEDSTISISTFAMQMFRACDLFSVFFMYIVINNLLLKDKLKNNIKYCIPILLYIVISLFVSGRTASVKLLISGMFIGFILYRKYFQKKLEIKKIIKVVLIFMVIALPLFYLLMPLIGRSQKTDMVSYLTFYLGSPVPSFNEIIERGEVGHLEHFGEETFKGVQAFLNRFGLVDYYSPLQRQWIGFNGLSSNIFTGLKTYYSDFGICGVVLFQILFAIIVTLMYLKAKNSNEKFYLIFFAFYGAYMLIDQYRLEKLFATMVKLDAFIYFVYMIIIYLFLFKNVDYLKKIYKKGKEMINGRGIVGKN